MTIQNHVHNFSWSIQFDEIGDMNPESCPSVHREQIYTSRLSNSLQTAMKHPEGTRNQKKTFTVTVHVIGVYMKLLQYKWDIRCTLFLVIDSIMSGLVKERQRPKGPSFNYLPLLQHLGRSRIRFLVVSCVLCVDSQVVGLIAPPPPLHHCTIIRVGKGSNSSKSR